jgi:hypothetical protein
MSRFYYTLLFVQLHHAEKTLKACNGVHAVAQGMTVEAGNGKADQGGKVVCWGADYAGQSSPPPNTQKFMVGVSVGWEHSVCVCGFMCVCVCVCSRVYIYIYIYIYMYILSCVPFVRYGTLHMCCAHIIRE